MPQNPKNSPDISYGKTKPESGAVPCTCSDGYTLSLSSLQAVVVPDSPFALVLRITADEKMSTPSALRVELVLPKNAFMPAVTPRAAWVFSDGEAPSLVQAADSDGTITLSIAPECFFGESAKPHNLYVAVQLPTQSQIVQDRLTLEAILYADGNTVASASASFPVSCAHLELHKERIDGSSADKAAFRIRLINNGTAGACSIEVEDILPHGFVVEHVLYCGIELAESVQYAQEGRRLRIKLPTCIRPQTEAELKIVGRVIRVIPE